MKTNKPISQWTKEECFAEVERLGCIKKKDVHKFSQPLYRLMCKNGWIDEIFGKNFVVSKMSKEECFEEVKKSGYTKKYELQVNNQPLYKRMRKNGWLDEYPWSFKGHQNRTYEECYTNAKRCKTQSEFSKRFPQDYQYSCLHKTNGVRWLDTFNWLEKIEHTNAITVINSFIENIDFWDALTIPEILGLASAFGSNSLMGKMLKKLAKSGPDSEERKFTLDSIKEMADMSEDEALEELNKDEDDEVKENDMVEELVKAAENMPADEVEYHNELERIGKVMMGVEKLQGNKDIMNIINSGDIIKTLKDSITKRILLLSFEHPQVFDELTEKFSK